MFGMAGVYATIDAGRDSLAVTPARLTPQRRAATLPAMSRLPLASAPPDARSPTTRRRRATPRRSDASRRHDGRRGRRGDRRRTDLARLPIAGHHPPPHRRPCSARCSRPGSSSCSPARSARPPRPRPGPSRSPPRTPRSSREVDALERELDLIGRDRFVNQQARGYGLGGDREIAFTLDPAAPPCPTTPQARRPCGSAPRPSGRHPLEVWLTVLFGPLD